MSYLFNKKNQKIAFRLLKGKSPGIVFIHGLNSDMQGLKAKSIENVSSHSVNLTRSSLLPELSHGTQTGFDKKNAKKLKRGQHPIEGQLDLHGMTQNQAHTALSHFIQNAFQAGKRCVLVITGKGFKIDGSIGVLRLAVPRWLNEEPNRGRVLAFSYAMPKDGGEGALYIMLKRKR